MGTKLTSQDMQPTPVVYITGKEGGKFVGTLLGLGVERPVKKGKKMVYPFAILENEGFPIEVLNQETNKYEEAKVAEGDKVAIFAPTVLNKALLRAQVGQKITIVYLGMQPGKNGDYHNFDVEAD